MEEFYDSAEDIILNDTFDQYGEYRYQKVAAHDIDTTKEFYDAMDHLDVDDVINNLVDDIRHINVHKIQLTPTKPDFQLLCPLFGWSLADTIQRIFNVTTQFALNQVSNTLKHHWQSCFPVCNVNKQCNEPVAFDTVFSDTPAVDCGVTAAQIFVGCNSLVTDVCVIKQKKEFVNTLEFTFAYRDQWIS
jgi:hypothetical protein